MKFRSKPVEIEAVQWTGDNEDEVAALVVPVGVPLGLLFRPERLWVAKSRAWCDLPVGHWIIKEPDGSGFYPCAPEIFSNRWELIPEVSGGADSFAWSCAPHHDPEEEWRGCSPHYQGDDDMHCQCWSDGEHCCGCGQRG